MFDHRSSLRSSRSVNDALARGLGYVSLALGLAEIFGAASMASSLRRKGSEGVIRAFGFREVANGVAILSSHDATPWVWGRLAGDMMDLAFLASGANEASQPTRASTPNAIALTVLLAATAADVVCASRLAGEKGSRRTATHDYRSRTGFPRGLRAAWGAGREQKLPVTAEA